ncbi:MAG: META domain-containing protein [Victivallaceae bacterium]
MKQVYFAVAVCAAAAWLAPLAGCRSFQPEEHFRETTPALDRRIIGSWELETLSSPDAADLTKPEKAVTITFAAGRISGCAGVNNFFSEYMLTGEMIKFGRIGTTMMAGPGLEYERQVLGVLNQTDRVAIESTSLCFYRGDELLATFKPLAVKAQN